MPHLPADARAHPVGIEVVGQLGQEHAIEVLPVTEVLAELLTEVRHRPTLPHQPRRHTRSVERGGSGAGTAGRGMAVGHGGRGKGGSLGDPQVVAVFDVLGEGTGRVPCPEPEPCWPWPGAP